MTTGNELITGALDLVTSTSPGEAIDGPEAENALKVMNRMLAGWSADSLMPPCRTIESFPLVANQVSYTIGTGANFSTPRPDAITYVFRRDANGQDTTLTPLTKEQYNAIVSKSTPGLADSYYYDPQYPNGVLYLYPPHSAAHTLYIESLKPFNQFTTLQTTMLLPGEYQETIIYLLTERLAPAYGNDISQDTRIMIEKCNKRMMRKNAKPKAAVFDAALSPAPPFNIQTG